MKCDLVAPVVPIAVPLLARAREVNMVQAVLVELPQLQFIDSRRHFNCEAEAVVVPQIPFIARVVDISLCSEMGTQLSAVVLWW